jgi:hypothetical protein
LSGDDNDVAAVTTHRGLQVGFGTSRSSGLADAIYEPPAGSVLHVCNGRANDGFAALNALLHQHRTQKASLTDVLLALIRASEYVGDHSRSLIHLRELLYVTNRSRQAAALSQHRLHLQMFAQPTE